MGKRIEELQQQIRKIEDALPRERETGNIVRQIDLQAKTFKGLQVDQIHANKPEKASNYWELPVKVQMKGNFMNFYDFLLKMEQLARITCINQMKLSRINEMDGSTTADLTLSIYYATRCGEIVSILTGRRAT